MSRERADRRAIGLAELLILLVLGVSLLITLMNMSSKNLSSQDELASMMLAQDLCMDVAERLKAFKTCWVSPQERITVHPRQALAELYPPVDLRPGQTTLFDMAYLERTEGSGMEPEISYGTEAVKDHPGLFKLQVLVNWKGRDGRTHSVRHTRYCFAP